MEWDEHSCIPGFYEGIKQYLASSLLPASQSITPIMYNKATEKEQSRIVQFSFANFI